MDNRRGNWWAGLSLSFFAEVLTWPVLTLLLTLFVVDGKIVLGTHLPTVLVGVLVVSGLASYAARRLRDGVSASLRGRTVWHVVLLLADLIGVWLVVAIPGVADVARMLVLALLAVGLLPSLVLAVRDTPRWGWGGVTRNALQWLAASAALVQLGAVIPAAPEVWSGAALIGTAMALLVAVGLVLLRVAGSVRRWVAA